MSSDTSGSSDTSVAQSAPGWVGVVLAAVIFVLVWPATGPVANGEVVRIVYDWVPSLGVTLGLRIDGLALTFALLISGIGVFVMLYSTKYMAGHQHYARFFLYLSLFMLAMLGVVLADNLIALFVFWELTSITSYLLIGFSHSSETSRRSALQGLLVTGAGGLALLDGVLVLGSVAGTFDIDGVIAQADVIKAHDLYEVILALFLLGAFTKSAQVPFHFWLPNAMAAPTPVSSYLHSATMVKAGIYLMARMHPVLGGTEVWLWTLTIFGGVTAVFASFLALKQTDMKQVLAYTTLMALGTLTMGLGSSNPYAITGAMTFLVVHSLYKAPLFLVAGIVDHETGTREVDRLGGLVKFMPLTAIAAGLAALSMAGLPPFIGFIAKEVAYKAAWDAETLSLFIVAASLLANALMFAAAGVVAFRPFWVGTHATPMDPDEGPWRMLAGPLVLAVIGLGFGLFPGWLESTLIHPTVASVLGAEAKPAELYLWGGFNAAVALSGATIGGGLVLYLLHQRLRKGLQSAGERLPSFDRGWDRFMDGVKALADWQTARIQTGILRHYLYMTFSVLLIAVAGTMVLKGGVEVPSDWPDFQPKHWVVVLLIVAGTALTTITNSRITAIAGLGAVGIGVALVFIIYGAPDVAITQLLVETLIVVLFAVAALKLPRLKARDGFPNRKKDAIFATAIGAVTAAIVATVTAGPIDRRIADYFEKVSVPDAHGQNIVNVILVDFRALDTFGEVAVVAVAAIAAWGILRTASRKRQEDL